jgi:hypothetical protein
LSWLMIERERERERERMKRCVSVSVKEGFLKRQRERYVLGGW